MRLIESELVDYWYVEEWDYTRVNIPFLEIDYRLPELNEITAYILEGLTHYYYASNLPLKEVSYRSEQNR